MENTGYDVDDGALYIGTKRMCLMVFAKNEANRGTRVVIAQRIIFVPETFFFNNIHRFGWHILSFSNSGVAAK